VIDGAGSGMFLNKFIKILLVVGAIVSLGFYTFLFGAVWASKQDCSCHKPDVTANIPLPKV